MALQVWLPLNGNLNNQGLAEVSVTNSGSTIDSYGKIGSCYKNTADDNGIVLSGYMDVLKTYSNYSMCAWIYMTDTATAHSSSILSSGNWNSDNGTLCFGLYNYNTDGYWNLLVPNTVGWYISISLSEKIALNKWYHITVTWNGSTTKAYINGNYVGQTSYGGICTSSETTNLKIGAATYYGGFTLKGKFNDIRIYDHCLSPREVKDIAKGLVLHYKLDDGYSESTVNYIPFQSDYASWGSWGFGSTGTKTVMSGDTPNGTCVFCRVGSTRETVGATEMTRGSEVIGQALSSGEQVTFSAYVRGVGATVGKSGFLHVYSSNGTQNQSDTVTTFTFTSEWTRVSGQFTWTNSNPSGTTCSVYIVCSNDIAGDVFDFCEAQLERKGYATPFTPSSRTASTVYPDCSGFEHDGIIAGSLQVLEDSPRYDHCTKFSGNEYIDVGAQLYMVQEAITVSCWCKYTGTGIMRLLSCTEGGGWNLEDYNGEGKFNFALFTTKGEYSPNIYTTTVNDGNWHMVTGTFDGRYKKIYTDGVLTNSTDLGATYKIQYYQYVNLYVGRESPSGYNANGCMSDVRIYATALSDADVMELYNTSAIIDNYGNGECLEAVENYSSIDITKTGLLETQAFIEVYDYLYLPAGTYINTGVHYDGGDSCAAVTTMRYASGGSGRDLMGYSPAGAGYWGTSDGGWELHGDGTYTNSDITAKNTISWSFYSPTENGTYLIGALANTWSVRDKYIYRVKLYKNDVLQLDLYPARQGTTCGLLDKLTGTFYTATTDNATVGNDDRVVATFYTDNIEFNQLIEI